MISRPSHSPMLDHSIVCNTKIDISKLKILDQIRCKFSFHILESLYIHKEKPKLHNMHSVTHLLVVRSFFYFLVSYMGDTRYKSKNYLTTNKWVTECMPFNLGFSFHFLYPVWEWENMSRKKKVRIKSEMLTI